MKLIICDIDGVLADCSHRLHYLKEKNYDAFYGACMADDKAIKPGIVLYDLLGFDDDNPVYHIILTGRSQSTGNLTRLWLVDNSIYYDYLLMRRDGDYRPSPVVKVELLQKFFRSHGGFDEIYFIDDDPKNVKAVCETFPQITGITFGIKRMEEKK